MREFEFTERDEIGEETLEAMGKADRFNRWMYQTIKPHCKGKVLEIGSGAGNISKYFLADDFNITLSDIRESYCHQLSQKFGTESGLDGIIKLNLTDPHFNQSHKKLFNSFDTVFALNVVEHIEDDVLAINNAHKLLRPGGHLIILVPSYQKLYNRFDTGLGHYRRYTKKSLSRIFLLNDFTIIAKKYFNLIGIFGWFFSGRILRKEMIPEGQMKIFNRLVPLFKIADTAIFQRFGLSTIVVGKKR
jgi:2-polyprenyl-3-methyl-5-hydroxy-6-metoxy-1,4-benzoquinol methylase